MKKNKPNLSLGTILALCLTAAVTVGCVYMFGIMRSKDTDARMDAKRVLSVVDSFMAGQGTAPTPQTTVVTVTITMAPVANTATPVTKNTVSATDAPSENKKLSFSLTAGGLIAFHSDISDSVYNKTDKTYSVYLLFLLQIPFFLILVNGIFLCVCQVKSA